MFVPLLAGGTALLLYFYLIFRQPVLFIFRQTIQTAAITKKRKANGKGNNTQNFRDWRTRLFIFLP